PWSVRSRRARITIASNMCSRKREDVPRRDARGTAGSPGTDEHQHHVAATPLSVGNDRAASRKILAACGLVGRQIRPAIHDPNLAVAECDATDLTGEVAAIADRDRERAARRTARDLIECGGEHTQIIEDRRVAVVEAFLKPP